MELTMTRKRKIIHHKQILQPSQKMLLLALLKLVITLTAVSWFFYATKLSVFGATDDTNMLNLLRDNYSTTGSLAFVQKYGGLIVWITRAAVSVCGILIITLQIIQFGATITYLSYTPFFDFVNDVQQGGSSQGRWNSGGVLGVSTGGDIRSQITSFSLTSTVMFFVAKCFIDVKSFADDSVTENVDMTALEYARNGIVKFIVLVILGYGLWKGQIQDIVANFAEGGSTIGDYVANWDASSHVRSLMEADRDYSFVFPSTTEGTNKLALAKKLYNQMKEKVPNDRTSLFLQGTGAKIYSFVSSMTIPDTIVQNGFKNSSLAFKVYATSTSPNANSTVAATDLQIVTATSATTLSAPVFAMNANILGTSTTISSTSTDAYGWIIVAISATDSTSIGVVTTSN